MPRLSGYLNRALLCLLLFLAPPLLAVDKITVLGLFKDKAIVEIDGARRVLSKGQTSPEGVKLLAADSSGAELLIDGKKQRLALGSHIGSRYRAPKRTEVRIWPDSEGMYQAVGSINGYVVEFMVDTGATLIAMNANQARRMGIDFRLDGEPGTASTASGFAKMYRVTLDSVKVGDIELRNVAAAVIDGPHPTRVLLGMSFLGRVDMRREDRAMILRTTR